MTLTSVLNQDYCKMSKTKKQLLAKELRKSDGSGRVKGVWKACNLY